jgi:hypothetical protein
VQAFPSYSAYSKAKSAVIAAFTSNSIAQSVLAITHYFSPTYTLQNLFAEERQQIMQQLNQETLQRLDQLYEQVYRENYGILMAFHRDRIAVPQALQVAADITLSHRALEVIRALEQDITEPSGNLLNITVGRIAELEGIATEAHHFRCELKLPGAQLILERLIRQGLSQTLQDSAFAVSEPSVAGLANRDHQALAMAVEGIERLIALGHKLSVPLSLYKVQELFYGYWVSAQPDMHSDQLEWNLLVRLGHAMAMDVAAIG